MVRDLVHNLCESLVENIDEVAGVGKKTPPTPITYLTQWKIVGNSQVHTDEYLKSWKVSGNPDGVVLPNGYKRCKYLEFHGTEYFDTDIIAEQGISVDINFTSPKSGDSNGTGLFGCRTSAYSIDSFYVVRSISQDTFYVSYGGAVYQAGDTGNITTPNDNTTKINIKLDSSTYTVTAGSTVVTKNVRTTIVNGQNSIYIGRINGGLHKYVGKIFDIKFALNNNVVFNGIPCLDDNNIPCLYDTISQTTLYNQGTGTLGYELYPQPTEIWSCGEYNPIDGKYHILVQPLGGSIADIALTEPLRKVNDVADTIEFPSGTEGKALVTRPFGSADMGDMTWTWSGTNQSGKHRMKTLSLQNDIKAVANNGIVANILCPIINARSANSTYSAIEGISVDRNGLLEVYDEDYNETTSMTAFTEYVDGVELIYELATSTTELVDAPQIAEADSYSCVISQGGKAVEWSSFITN